MAGPGVWRLRPRDTHAEQGSGAAGVMVAVLAHGLVVKERHSAEGAKQEQVTDEKAGVT